MAWLAVADTLRTDSINFDVRTLDVIKEILV